MRAVRVEEPPTVDGDPLDPVWQAIEAVSTWYETNPADNVVAAAEVGGTARIAYDSEFLYALLELRDPRPEEIRAPLGAQDDISGNWTDYAGLVLDTQGTGQGGQMFLATARGVKYDAITSDASGEDSAPDFFWDAAGRITEDGWVLELRIPFASLRYADANPDKWGVLIYRNRPRDFRYQYFTQRMPRDVNCFVCNRQDLVGLADLPTGAHWVAAPYATGLQQRLAGGDGELQSEDPTGEIGVDLKWIPSPSLVVDATINPDFSQIESDTPQVAANERFALFFPEQRPFFLESVDLLATPIQAVSTRTFNDPRWGLRLSGGEESSRYTILVGQDDGGGVTIIPGPEGSRLAPSDDRADVTIGRYRRDFRKGFVSMLYAGRELDGGASNRVAGPDFEWRPTGSDRIVGQFLYSWSETPERPDRAEEWDGRELSGHAARIYWSRNTPTWDFFADTRDVADGFRADSGFVPQVGYRRLYSEVGRTFRYTDAPIRRLRLFGWGRRDEDRSGELLHEEAVFGAGLDATRNTFGRLEVAHDTVVDAGRRFDRRQLRPTIEMRPGRLVSLVGVYGRFGDDVDFVGHRAAKVRQLSVAAQMRPNKHLVVGLEGTRRALDLDEAALEGDRLFTASVATLRGVWTFDARSWLRLLVLWGETERNQALYPDPTLIAAREEAVDASLVFSWQLNWQSVLYVGWSESRLRDLETGLEPAGEQLFVKVSYAFQG